MKQALVLGVAQRVLDLMAKEAPKSPRLAGNLQVGTHQSGVPSAVEDTAYDLGAKVRFDARLNLMNIIAPF